VSQDSARPGLVAVLSSTNATSLSNTLSMIIIECPSVSRAGSRPTVSPPLPKTSVPPTFGFAMAGEKARAIERK